MRLELTGRHLTITPTMRKAVEQRLARLDRLLNDTIVSVQVVVARERSKTQVEMTLHARGDHFLHGAASGRDLAEALGAATEKIERQAQKLKGKWTTRKRHGASAARAVVAPPHPERARQEFGPIAGDDGNTIRIVRARKYAVKPMSVDEAALEVVEGTDAFLVFRNATTDTINVLFRRRDGHLGLIEPEA